MSVCAVSLAHITALAVTSWRRRNPYLNIESSDVLQTAKWRTALNLRGRRLSPLVKLKCPCERDLWPCSLSDALSKMQIDLSFCLFGSHSVHVQSRNWSRKESHTEHPDWSHCINTEIKGREAVQELSRSQMDIRVLYWDVGMLQWECRVVRMFRMFCTSWTWGLGDALLPPSVDVPQFTYSATQVEGQISPPIFKKTKQKQR